MIVMMFGMWRAYSWAAQLAAKMIQAGGEHGREND